MEGVMIMMNNLYSIVGGWANFIAISKLYRDYH